MKKLIKATLFLLVFFTITSCYETEKNEQINIVDNSEPFDHYEFSIGCGETMELHLRKFYSNSQVKQLLEDKAIKYTTNVIYVDENNDQDIDIKFKNIDTFDLTCVKPFEGKKVLERIVFENEKYRFDFPIYLVLTYNPEYDDCFINNFRGSVFTAKDTLEGYFYFTGLDYGYRSEDKIKITNIEMSEGELSLDFIGMYISDLPTSLIRIPLDDYMEFTYPLEIPTSGKTIDFRCIFTCKTFQRSIGQDMFITLEINGDKHIVPFHCIYFDWFVVMQ